MRVADFHECDKIIPYYLRSTNDHPPSNLITYRRGMHFARSIHPEESVTSGGITSSYSTSSLDNIST